MQKRLLSALAGISSLVLVFTLAGCDPNDFNDDKAGRLIEANPVHLDAEYVMLDGGQFDCGVREELWDAAPVLKGIPGEHAYAHLTDKGRALKFSDDVNIGDMRQPYVQIRGDFNLEARDTKNDRSGPGQNSRLVDVRLGVKMDHVCFPIPLILMGVHKGNFSQDYPSVVLFRLDNGWQFDRIMH